MAVAAKRLMKIDKKLQLASLYNSIDSLTIFLKPSLDFVNSHLTEFFTANHWENVLSSALRADLESKSIEEIQQHLTDLVSGSWRNYICNSNNTEINFQNVQSMNDLIVATGKLQLSSLGVSVPLKEFRINGKLLYHPENLNNNSSDREGQMYDVPNLEFDSIMSAKKTHEVELMSDVILRISQSVSAESAGLLKIPVNKPIEYLVDIGSGKGYLSSYLTLMHKFKLLAVDSSSINTTGCERRSAKLEKTWVQLIRRAVERRETGKCTKRGKNWKSKKKSVKSEQKFVTETGNKVQNSTDSSETTENGTNKLLKTLTQFVTPDFDLTESIAECFPTSEVEERPFYGLIGLHTCGPLAVDSLKLFIINEKAQFICNVPCCYHLLQENRLFYTNKRFEGSRASVSSEVVVDSILNPSFPLSRKLDVDEPNRFCLGRNARMLSAYSLPRMVHQNKGLELPASIFYRSVLQILIKNGLGDEYSDMEDWKQKVGKISDKCANFNDYVRKGLRNLQLDYKIQLSDESISEVQSQMETDWRDRLHKYYLLRSIFASLIEGLIIVDRLAFLLEQDCVAEGNIVELFDSSISPRSFALVAYKYI